MRVYPNDCVLYQPGEAPGTTYAACGSSTPRAIASYPPWRMGNQWEALPEGLRRVDPAHIDSAGRVVATTEFFSIAEIERAARDPGYALEPVVRDEVVDVNTRGRYGRTPLLEAINDGDTAVVQALIRAGADVNAADSGNIHPLQMAAGRLDAKPAIVEALLRAGANPCARTHTGEPLYESVIANPSLAERLKTAAAHCK
jgi:ankyrin repeat protein